MGWIIWGIGWNIVGWTLLFTNPHPHLDLHHCGYDPVAFVQSCFPKHGCYVDWSGNAMCWDRAQLKGKP